MAETTRNTLVQDARLFPLRWRAWFWLLTLLNGVAPLLFLGRVEAQVTLGVYVLIAALMVLMYRRLGWVRLLGVGHLPWLAHRYQVLDQGDLPGAWILALLIIDAACLLIDGVDVVRYLGGERSPIV